MPTIASPRLALSLVAALLCAGCAPLSPPPPVDVLGTAPPQLAPLPTTVPATGGIYSNSRYRPGFEDRRARYVGDAVTIRVSERLDASQASTSNVNRTGTISGGISALPFVGAASLAAKANIGATSDNKFSGDGATTNVNTFTSDITATVSEVLPNGHLIVTAERQIGVNHNVDVLRFSGTVDPRALQPGSIVNSYQVANVRIESRGRGAQAEAQAIGWLSRIFNAVTPF